MTQELMSGLILFAIGIVLLYIGMPKHGVTPRFLQFDASVVVYPPLILIFLAAGTIQILRALL